MIDSVSRIYLENISACPVCGSDDRSLMYCGLKDYISSYRNLAYQLWNCMHCGSAYYDPRPTQESIGLLYDNYGTHSSPARRRDYIELNRLGRIRRIISNSYINRRYGTHEIPAVNCGYEVVNLLPPLRGALDFSFRYIPKASQDHPMLLDFGCGNGGFLQVAARCGFEAYGVDFDNQAVSEARKFTKNVYHGGIESLPEGISFDVITLSHAIEHLYQPREYLSRFYSLLKPGGFIYIETPNIDSAGHQYLKAAWRGLEPPRHIQIFSHKALSNMLQSLGYVNIRTPGHVNPIGFICDASSYITNTKNNDARHHLNSLLCKIILSLSAAVRENKREFIIMTAQKPEVGC